MDLSKQCCTAAQAKKLRELGITQTGLFTWLFDIMNETHKLSGQTVEAIELQVKSDPHSWAWKTIAEKGIYSAFTCAELGALLPKDFGNNDGHMWSYYHRHNWKGESVGYTAFGVEPIEQEWFEYEAEARADMLIKLLETGKVTAQRCNAAIK